MTQKRKVRFVQVTVDRNGDLYAIDDRGEIWMHYLGDSGELEWGKLESPEEEVPPLQPTPEPTGGRPVGMGGP